MGLSFRTQCCGLSYGHEQQVWLCGHYHINAIPRSALGAQAAVAGLQTRPGGSRIAAAQRGLGEGRRVQIEAIDPTPARVAEGAAHTRQPVAGRTWDQPVSHVRVLVTFHNTHSFLIIKVHLFYACVGCLLWEWVPGYTGTRVQQTDRKR